MWKRRRKQRVALMQSHIQGAADDEQLTAIIAQLVAEEEEEEHEPHRGSVFGRRVVYRDRHRGYHQLMQDYFVSSPVYNERVFRRRFRMPLQMFKDICAALAAYSRYFRLSHNAAGEAGFHTIQKVTASVRMLAYGGPADILDQYIRMGESTILECVSRFSQYICEIYSAEYLRPPNQHDIARPLAKAEERGFPGMLGSIDCMHWEWAKCPVARRGQFKKPSIILEAITSYDLWIWHAFFGVPGSCNDINVLHRSPMFDNLASGSGPKVNYTVNGREYNMGYYLADGIYPSWATLISPIPAAQNDKHKKFNQKHQELRKDVECGIGVLQAQYGIMNGPTRMWHPDELKRIVDCCIILHNMAIKYERDMEQLSIEDYEGASRVQLDSSRNVPEIHELIAAYRRIESRTANEQLKLDLVEHVWDRYRTLND